LKTMRKWDNNGWRSRQSQHKKSLKISRE
jgi:hypothetical protein